MNCKHCNAELPEDVTLCPVCGKEQELAEETPVIVEEAAAEESAAAEETVTAEEVVPEATEAADDEKKPLPFATEDFDTSEKTENAKPSAGKIALAVVAGVVAVAILIALIISGMNSINGGEEPTIAPTAAMEETVPVTIPFDGDPESSLCKASYTVSDEDAYAAADVVVATMGDRVLTNGQLQAYYWQEIYLFLQEYGNYAEYIGLDLYSPLDEQLTEIGEAPMSWQQFFLESAIYTWRNYQAMELEAEAAGYVMPADRQAELDNLPDDLENTTKSAGFENVEELLKSTVGAGCSLEDYLHYVKTYYHGMSYFYDYCENLDPTDEEIEAFFAENEAYYAENGITKDTKYVDVRHVLLQPEGGEIGENGYPVFTDEAWEACRQQTEEIYNKWLEGDKSEESFAVLANENTHDGNDVNGDGVPDGGLYENVYVGQMVEEFENWCFDETRQVGDHGLVKTSYGYHIMFFSGSRDAWYYNARIDLINEISYDMIPEVIEKHPSTVDYSLIVLGAIDLA